MGLLISTYDQWHKENMRFADERTKDWLLLSSSPIPVWAVTLLYIAFIYVGQIVMKNRKPFQLQSFIVVYNIGLVFLSLYMFIEILLSCYDAGYDFFCQDYNEETKKDPRELRVAQVLWWYFFSKVIELLDTVLMVLRKKNEQITVLHVFHHASMLNIWWWVMTFIPGGCSWFGSCMNCLVHVVMYSYYGLSAIPSLRNKLWWKRYITRFQLIQFMITLTHTMNTIWQGCDFPQWGKNLLAGYMIVMLVMFGNFYIQAYRRGAKIREHDKMKKDARTTSTQKVYYQSGPRSSSVASSNNTMVNGVPFENGSTKKKD